MSSEFLKQKRSMPVLGVGLGLRGHFAKEILEHRDAIDFLEFTPENFADNIVSTRWLSSFANDFPLVEHSVSLSIGSVDPLSKDLLAVERRYARMFGMHWWSDHLCFTGVDGRSSHDLLPLPWTEQTVKHVASRIRQAQEFVGKPLAIENIPFYTKMPPGNFEEAEFISRILEEADCGLLLDLNNLMVNSLNHGIDPIAFLDRLPLERVVQIHLAGHAKFGKRIVDTHGAPIAQPLMDMLAHVLSKEARVNAIMIERDQFFPEFSEILAELNAIRSVWEKLVPADLRAGIHHESEPRTESSVNITPPELVGELAQLEPAIEHHVDVIAGVADAVSLQDLSPDPLVEKQIPELGRYQREWFEIWQNVKGQAPLAVDSEGFSPAFVEIPDNTTGYDLGAISIYAWLRDSNRDYLLRSVFPASHMVLGKVWKEVLEGYFYKWKPVFLALKDIGNELRIYLQKHFPELLNEYPFLDELLEYELLLWQSAHKHELTAAASEVYLGTPEQIKQCRPLVNPELVIAHFKYPVEQMHQCQERESLFTISNAASEAEPYAVLPHGFQSKGLRLSKIAERIIDDARLGKRTYSQLMARVMTEEERQSPGEIADFIRMLQRLHEDKIFLRCIYPETNRSWQEYADAIDAAQAHRTIEICLANFEKEGVVGGEAIDLGCGTGRDTRYLLSKGWKVRAIDSCNESLETLKAAVSQEEQKRNLVIESIDMRSTRFPEKVQLINAGLSLPFCGSAFWQTWQELVQSLDCRGRFSGHFFGLNDDWSQNPTMVFHDRAAVISLFDGFEIEFLEEYEGPMPVVPDGTKNGHLFEVVARKL